MKPEDWEALDTRRPRLSMGSLSRALKRLFGIDGNISVLAEERDQVFLLTTKSATKFIVRASCRDQLAQSAIVQNEALDAVAAADPLLPVPRVLRSKAGRSIEATEEGRSEYQIRLLSHLPGRPMAPPWSEARLHQIGLMASRLDRALTAAPMPEKTFPLLWNLAEAHQLLPFLDFIEDRDLRALVERALLDFSERTLPELRKLPSQLIHNDLSPKNILFSGSDQREVSGIIDFGDIVAMPRIVDLAIAIARFTRPEDPISPAMRLIGAYSENSPLSTLELATVPSIVQARLAMRVAVWSWRLHKIACHATNPVHDASALLRAVARLGNDTFLSTAPDANRARGPFPKCI